MLTFKQHALLKPLVAQIKKESYGIERHEMPQIAGNHYSNFREWLANNEVTVFEKEIVPSQFKATQKEFNQDKIEGMCRNDYSDGHKPNPILISNDGYILDGHHRWVCHWIQGDQLMLAAEIPLAVNDCLTLLRDYDKTTYKKVE